jgi:CHAT domain-containing protein/tetratricopeptide (TPR) repeat protein
MAGGIHKAAVSASFILLFVSGCRKQPPSPIAVAKFEIAESSFERGDLKVALSEVDSALQQKNLDPDATWDLRLLKSEILIWQGLSRDALPLLTPGRVSEPRSAELGARRSTLRGIAETNLQQLDLAAQTFHETAEMPGADSPKVMGDLLLGEGKLSALRHDPAQSELLFRRALTIAQEHDQTFLAGNALGNLGMLEMQQYHYAEAVDRFNASLAMAERLGAQASIVRTTVNLGWAYLQMGDLDRASDLFDDAKRRSEQLGMIADQETAIMNIAVVESARREFSPAEQNYLRALKLARQMDDKQEVAYSLADLAQIAIVKQDLELAQKYNQEALALERLIGDHGTELWSLVNEAQIAASKMDYETAVRYLRKVVDESKSDLILRAQAFSTLAGIDAKRHNLEAANMNFKTAIASLEAGRLSFVREEFKFSYPVNAKAIYDDYIDFLVQRGMADEAFRVVEKHRATTLTEGLGQYYVYDSGKFNIQEAKEAASRSGQVVLSYWVGPEKSFLWIFLPGHSQLVTLPGEDQIRPLIERYRAHLKEGFASNNVADASGEELYSMLVEPVERWIEPQSQVTVIPDGPLCSLNFETLVVKTPKPHFWIEDVSVTNASSALLLTSRLRSAAGRSVEPPQQLLLIGNPRAPENYSPLSHAGEEMQLIKDHFSPEQETVISGTDATPAAYFRTKPEGYALIHFVAHGTASRASALDSAVVLSEDGKSHNLYARDIAGTRLHARLVTISACDSAGNRIYSSEGLVGLSWAFLRAGAERVIAALWEVNDASTPQLMDRMYASIAAGEEPSSALRAAKLSLLRSQTVYSRPFYWAPFVLYQGI